MCGGADSEEVGRDDWQAFQNIPKHGKNKRCEEDAWQREEEEECGGVGGDAEEGGGWRRDKEDLGHPSHASTEGARSPRRRAVTHGLGGSDTHAHTHTSGGERLACSELSIGALVSGSARAQLPRRCSQPPR